MAYRSFFIADSGGTKTEWAFIKDGKHVCTLYNRGTSPQVLGSDEIVQILKEELLPQLDADTANPEAVFIYGAGLSIQKNIEIAGNAYRKIFPNAYWDIQHDMLGAARGLCLNQKGIAAILGTGSSSAVYDGKQIAKSRTGIGFILGDEGSGAYMGKKLVNMYCFDELPKDIAQDLEESYQVNRDSVLEGIYKGELPNKYLASFAKFIFKHQDHPLFQDIIHTSLDNFFTRHLLKFEEAQTMPLNFIGGVAHIFKDHIKKVCDEHGVQLGTIARTPIDGLIQYHLHYSD